MTPSRSLSTYSWLFVLICAGAFVFWAAQARVSRLEEVSQLGASSSTQANTRTLLVPLHAQGSFEWIAQAHQAQETGAWRVRQITYDNAPTGRETHLASPYRWWLEAVSWLNGLLSGNPPATALERAVLWSGPCLQLLVLIALTVCTARAFGGAAAIGMALGWAFLFPLSTAFLPGRPDDVGLKAGLIVAHGLLLLRGLRAAEQGDPASTRRWWVFAGATGGLGLWVNLASHLPILGGFLLGGAWLAWRKSVPASPLPWRHWAAAGASIGVAAWIFEYAFAHLFSPGIARQLPLYALAWCGGADLVARLSALRGAPASPPSPRGRLLGCMSLAALLAPVAAMLFAGTWGFPGAAANASQLTTLDGGIAAAHLGAWLSRDGLSGAALATLLPVAAIVLACVLLGMRSASPAVRRTCWLALGPVLVTGVLAIFRLHAWSLLDGALLVLFVALLAALPAGRLRVIALSAGILACVPGLFLLTPTRSSPDREVSGEEVEALVARDLAHWLTRRAGTPGAVVLAPPALTAALTFYGDLRGIGTTYWENRDGMTAAVRIMGATSADEALALAERREVRYVILPSWDPTLEDLARFAAEDFDKTLAGLLRQWLPPRWLRPVPYVLPGIAGLESRAVMIFEVVEAQDNATALARLAEYFLEMGQPQLAAPVAAALKQAFPNELSALAGRLYVEMAQRDTAAVNATIAAIQAQLSLKADEILPWERRVSLALALAQARQPGLAQPLLNFTLETVDEDHLRSLTTGALYRFLAVTKATGGTWPAEDLRQDALSLLPPEWRDRL